MEARIYITTDSRSSRESVKWYGYVLECMRAGHPLTKRGFGMATGTYHKATLAALADALQRFLCPCEICVCTEDSFVLNMLGRNLAAWAGNGFLSSRGMPVANAAEWEKVWEKSRGHTLLAEPGPHTYGSWLLGEIEREKREQEAEREKTEKRARMLPDAQKTQEETESRKEQDDV